MSIESSYSEKLFSYGTLQYESVQISTFGRKLNGVADVLTGYHLTTIEISDRNVIEASGNAVHPILIYTGNESDEVQGIVFDVTLEELLSADQYEVAEYKRVSEKLRSGENAWVYVSINERT